MKKTIRLTETDLKRMIAESVRNALNEGIYDYPDGIDHLIFLFENDRECYDLANRTDAEEKARQGG